MEKSTRVCIKKNNNKNTTEGYTKHFLNSDGSSQSSSGLAGGGGLIRKSDGEWVKEYARSMGSTSSTMAEL